MEKASVGPKFEKPYVLDGTSYSVSVDGTSFVREVDGIKTLEVVKGPHLVGIESAEAIKRGANIVVIETPGAEMWAKKNCERLEDVLFEELNGSPRYRINSNYLAQGGHVPEPVYRNSSLTMQPIPFQREGAYGMFSGISEYEIFVAKDNPSLTVFFTEHLPLYSGKDTKAKHLVFIVPPGGGGTINDAMRKSGLGKTMKSEVVGSHRKDVTGVSAKTLQTTVDGISKNLKAGEDEVKRKIETAWLKKKEEAMFEIPHPDKRKVDLGWKESSIKEKARIAKKVADELTKYPSERVQILEKAKVLASAGDRMRKCPFTPSGVGVQTEDLLPDQGMTTSDLKIKNAAMDILTEVWDKSPDVVRGYIIAASDLTALPHLRNHSELIWKRVREARTNMQEYRNYLLGKGKSMPEHFEPEFIAQMVYYAFPEITQNNSFRYSVSQNELRKDVGEEPVFDRDKFDLTLLERAAKLYPRDAAISDGLAQHKARMKK